MDEFLAKKDALRSQQQQTLVLGMLCSLIITNHNQGLHLSACPQSGDAEVDDILGQLTNKPLPKFPGDHASGQITKHLSAAICISHLWHNVTDCRVKQLLQGEI